MGNNFQGCNDVRILNLKRWNLPQTMHLQELENGIQCTPAMYVSSQSYHFIDIMKGGYSNKISDVYKQVEKMRTPIKQSFKDVNVKLCSEIHTVQSITLLGKDKGFWENQASHLNITFIQLTNSQPWQLSELECTIASIMENVSSNGSQKAIEWALYYSLDFCDLILFTKDISIKDYYDVLWNLSLYRQKDCAQIRDTFSLFCFGSQYIKAAFTEIENNRAPKWDDYADLQIRLSVQTVSTLDKFLAYLEPFKDKYQAYRLPGRYDVNVFMHDMQGSDILKIYYYLDKLSHNEENEVFASYDITFLTSLEEEIRHGLPAPQNHKLVDTATLLLEDLCRKYCQKDNLHANYAEETRKALLGLLKRGFSDEFVVSVLLSFISYLKICIDVDNGQQQSGDLQKNFIEIKHRYFGAINTISLCTMHSERQFIQAPAYNATYFDIPPKLLAFYTALSNEICRKIITPPEPPYRFIIVPDFRKDINVVPLTTKLGKEAKEHLAVVYLAERYFYNPTTAIRLLSHEIGHYVGERKREERALSIFYSVSIFHLSQTILVKLITKENTFLHDNSILNVLAKSLSGYIKKVYEQWQKGKNGIKYSLEEVSDFLRRHEWGLRFIDDKQHSGNIIMAWKKAIKCELHNEHLQKEYETILNALQTTLSINYFANIPHCDEAVDLVSRFCIHYAQQAKYMISKKNPIDNLNKSEYISALESIIQAYSESLADLRMYEICGALDALQYDSILGEICGTTHKFHQILRHDAICLLYGYSDSLWSAQLITNEMAAENPEQVVIFNTISHHIRSYLERCRINNCTTKLVKDALEDFGSNNITKQFELIHKVIHNYRSQLCHYCKTEYRNQPNIQSKVDAICTSCIEKCEWKDS